MRSNMKKFLISLLMLLLTANTAWAAWRFNPHTGKLDYYEANTDSGGAPEGTAVLSTGEGGGTKFLREDGDGTCSWQTAVAAHAGTITWTGTAILESGVAFQFGDGTDATLTHTYANTGTDVSIAYSTGAMAVTGALTATNLSGTNTGDNTVATSGDSATSFFASGEIADAQISDTLTSSTCTGNSATVTNATLTTALTVDTGTVGLTGNVANTSVLTLGAGASSISGANTGDSSGHSALAPLDSPVFTTALTVPVGLTGVLRADTGVMSVDTDVTDLVTAASTSAQGKIEIATSAETTTGTDATRAVSPDGLAGSDYGKRVIQIKVIDDATALTTGDGKTIFVISSELNGYNLMDADAMVSTVSSSGTPTYQIRNVTDSQDMLSTLITIDANENTSYTAETPPVINGTYDDVATGDILAVDKDVAGTGEKGDTLILTFQLP